MLLECKLECDGFDLYYWVNAGNIIVYLKSTFYSGILQYQGKIMSTNDVAASTPLGDISLYTSNQVWPVDFQNDGKITLPFCVEVILPLCQISLCTSNQLSAAHFQNNGKILPYQFLFKSLYHCARYRCVPQISFGRGGISKQW